MGEETLTFGDVDIEKNNFCGHKCPIISKVVDIVKVIGSNKTSYAEEYSKYFIGHLYDDCKVKPLHIIFPKTSVYVKSFDGQAKWMYFLTKDNDLLEKYDTVWVKFSAEIKK